MKKLKQTKGITLIALIITIIVMLILAGITINLTIGQDGILRRAEEAGKNYTNAAEYERNQLAEFLNETDKIIGNVTGGSNTPTEPETPPEWSDVYTTTQKDNYTDKSGKKATIPAGFQVSLKAGETEVDTGLVVRNAEDKNEFVWIPVNDTTTYSYERVAFSRADWTYTQTKGDYDEASQSYKIIRADATSYYYTETMPTIAENRTELDSVTEYKGFYIGRYEVGVTGFDANVSKENSNSETNWTGYSNGTAVVQKGVQVWNYITRDKAKEIAEGMYTSLDNVTSRLCSSYAWDTALKFIETQNSSYPTNSEGGNYSTSSGGTGKLQQTGYDKTHPCNIYDMGGNVNEWTTEAFSYASGPCTGRGGNYGGSSSSFNPAANRHYSSTPNANDYVGFRSTLYL